MRADRLLSILLLLQHHGRLTTRELAARLEVSERTIHRDMDALSSAGVPVYAERGANGGWSLAEGYRTNLTGMKADEMKSLLLAHSSTLLSDLGLDQVFEKAMHKLLAAFPSQLHQDAQKVRERIHVDGAGWHQVEESLPALSLVQEAVWQEKKLLMRYLREDTEYERTVEPLGLVAKGSIWYLVASCEGEWRTYRVSRIKSAEMLAETFQRPQAFDLASYWEMSTRQFKEALPYYAAIVHVHEKALPKLVQHRYVRLLDQQTGAEDGWICAEVDFQTVENACEVILGMGSLIVAKQPEELRQLLVSQAKAVVRLYEADDGSL